VVMLGLYPLAIAAWERGEDVTPIIRSGLRYFLLLGLPAAVGLALLARPLLSLVAGREYADAWPALALLAGGMLAFGCSQFFSIGLAAAKRTGVIAWVSLGAGAANLALALTLVPRFGFVAAAGAGLAANVLLAAAMAARGLPDRRAALPWPTIGRTLAAGAVMAAGLWLGRDLWEAGGAVGMLAACGAGALVYGAVLAAGGELRAELDWLRRRRGR